MTRLERAFLLFSTAFGTGACTETPSYLPPCVDPQIDPCSFDAGSDGDAGALLDGARTTTDASDDEPREVR